MSEFLIRPTNGEDVRFSKLISDTIAKSASERGVGVAARTPEYITNKIEEGKGVIALTEDKRDLAGFCYIESWGHQKYVANSGLIVLEEFRGKGLSRMIKEKAFSISRERWPKAKIFSITTSEAVMKINNRLGYKSVGFSQLTDDDEFWEGCSSCAFYDVLKRTDRTKCLCNGMLFDPNEK